MEKNSLSNSLKDHSIGSRPCNNSSSSNNNSNKQIKYPWNYNSTQNYGEDYLSGFSWPPRSYTCSFCKREFRSAQALGGHMNVHRRDRARLRQSPPSRDGESTILNLNMNPNPSNPTLSSPYTCMFVPSSAPSIPPPATTTSALTSPSCGSSSETKKWAIDDSLFLDPISLKNFDVTKSRTRKSFLDDEEFDGITQEDGCKSLKKAEIVRLDLEIGLLSDDSKEELDLELRLGCS